MTSSKSSKKKSRPAHYRKPTSYGARPYWHWIVIYALIGAVSYGLVYYLVISPKREHSYKSPIINFSGERYNINLR